jgi:hypothetical protein
MNSFLHRLISLTDFDIILPFGFQDIFSLLIKAFHQKLFQSSNRRFIVLLVFFMCSVLNGFVYLSFVVAPEIYMEYFDISMGTIGWTTQMSMLGMTVFIFPVTSLCKKINLREITLTLCLATMITSVLKENV